MNGADERDEDGEFGEDVGCSEQQRTACAIGGAFTALAIEGVLPVMHSGPGCLQNASGVIGRFNGGLSGVSYPESIVPSTNFCEKDVVFGGRNRLLLLTQKCLEYYKADMLLLVDGCSSEIIGDDIAEVASEFAGGAVPVLYAKLPGFKGNNLWGHSQVLQALIEQYVARQPKADVNPRQVNVFGIVPYYDTFWMGTLEAVETMLSAVGIEPNIIYGRGKGAAALRKIPQAAFNLVLSPWTDLDIAEKLHLLFGTPYFQYPCLPIGPAETGRFLRALADYAKLDAALVEDFLRKEEERYYFYVRNAVKVFAGGAPTPKTFYINASASMAVSITRFLVNDWGMTAKKVFITDGVPPEHCERVRAAIYDLSGKGGPPDFDLIFTNDGGLCDMEIRKEDFTFNKICLFGTCWDQLTANNLQLPFLAVSPPYGDAGVLDLSYFGYAGALAFVRDLYRDMTRKILGSGVVAKLDDVGGH